MIWISKGLIFQSSEIIKSIKSHAWVPTPIKINNEVFKIFYAGRDKFNHSNIYSFDYSFKKEKVIKYTDTPILRKGRLGCFDDCAVIPSHIIKNRNKYYLYYVGWTQGGSVPYISSIGLAISENINGKFSRYSEAPIIGKTKEEPIFVASCFIEKKNKFKMWYTSNNSWKKVNKKLIPKYNIKLATSNNGIDWKFQNKSINFKSKKEIAITRPWIVNLKKEKIMFYSYRGKNYKIGYAKMSKNNWIRKDNLKIINSTDLFDNQMNEYGSVINYKDKFYMFYNGNNYGEKGVGIAELKQK